MWRRLPFNVKLLGFLFAVQLVSLALVLSWLTSWLETTLMNEIRERLNTSTEMAENIISVEGNKIVIDQDEVTKELDKERHSYFLITDQSGEVLYESRGPLKAQRAYLREKLTEHRVKNEKVTTIHTPLGLWMVKGDVVTKDVNGKKLRAHIHTSISAQPETEELERFKYFLRLAALGIFLASGFGTGAVVSYSTRNLRMFSNHLRTIKPPYISGKFDRRPESAEEHLLFDSYNELIAAVRSSFESQRLFIAHASHELKTPLAAALSALEVLLAKPRSVKDYEQTCRDIYEEMKVLKRLTSSMLDLTRLESYTNIDSPSRTCDLIQVCSNNMERWTKIADTSAIKLIFEHEAIDTCILHGDEEQWNVVLSNFIENAIKYGRTRGYAKLTIQRSMPGQVSITITDDGIGMSEQEVKRLGHVFFRADASRTDPNSFGLGFAHAKRILEHLGAKIAVQSHVNVGTSINISIKEV